jgi:glutathione synthase/RimK-type ligase-like ATP-grasp enzyme
VDLKQFGDECVVIEVNDNPNVDSGVEDAVLGDELYLKVMDYFLKKIRSERNTPLPSSRRN